MQKEIKFRFWSGTKMFYDIESVMECLKQQIYFNVNGAVKLGYDHVGLHNSCFMQYTGLKDKNDKEIYEGDILLEPYRNHKFKVFAVGGGFAVNTHQDDLHKEPCIFYTGIGDMQNSSWITGCEIIGNVYEHAELLDNK